jgi:hypothetical protein
MGSNCRLLPFGEGPLCGRVAKPKGGFPWNCRTIKRIWFGSFTESVSSGYWQRNLYASVANDFPGPLLVSSSARSSAEWTMKKDMDTPS